MSWIETLNEAFTGIFKKGETEQVVTYKPNEQIVPDNEEDGAIQIAPSGFFGQYLDLENRTKSDDEYISLVRELSSEPEFDYAISEIINEMIVIDEDEHPVKLDLEDTELSQSIKDKITAEFHNILLLLKFTSRGYDIVRQWYTDGKLYYHIIIDEKNPKKGIQELKNIDPRRIKFIKEIEKSRQETGEDIIVKEKDYFVFNSRGKDSVTGVKLHPDRIIYVHSGLRHPRTGAVVSHLNKAIKRFNQLRILEESVIIYRFSRAPERRVFYIDIGNMPPKKGEKYVQDLMLRYRNKVVYDAQTGCFAMDTKVPLLDGRTLSISEIKDEYESGKELWAYSCDPKTGKFAPGLITWAGITRKDEKVLKITLDNGKEIVSTFDHKFLTRDGRKVEAKDLVVGESMMPFYDKTELENVVEKNHKIVSIEYLADTIDVGTLTIDGSEKYHNFHTFALEAGVYTFNSVKDDKKFMSLLEDYWIPKNSGGSGTKIETLSGSQLSNGMEDVDNFRKQFYLALNVPISRLEPEQGFSLGRASEISREEVKFARFCTRLRVRFSDLFDELLSRQLLLKNIMSKDDWEKIKQSVKYKYNVDQHFKILLDQEILQSKLRILQDVEQFSPMAYNKEAYPLYSVEWIKKHVLLQTEAEIQEMSRETEKEMKDIAKNYGTLPSQHELMPDGTPMFQLEPPPPVAPEQAQGSGNKPKQ